MRFWRTLFGTIARNPISFIAILCVACTAGFLAYMAVWQTRILSSADWCGKAMGAEKALPDVTAQQTLNALQSCNNLLMVQVSAIAIDSHINQGAFALVLVVLIVVVVAGARASFKASTSGIEGSVGREAEQAADKVAGAAVDAAEQVKTGETDYLEPSS